MALPTLTTFPQAITAGDTTLLLLSFADFPANGGFTAAMSLNQAGAAPQSVTGSASGSGFQFVISAAVSGALSAGLCTWAVRATQTSTGYVETAQGGSFTVLPNYATTITKSITQQQLDAANAALLTLVANPEAIVSFNGQSFTSASKAELLGVIRNLKAMVAAENATAAGLYGDAPTRSIRPFFC